VFFCCHVLWLQGFEGSFEWLSALIGAAAFIALLRYKTGIVAVIGVSAVVGFFCALLCP